MHLSNNLKVLRKHNKLSQEAAALRFGVKRSSYSAYETGVAEPKLDLLIRMADHFRISVTYLLREDLSLRDTPSLNMLLHTHSPWPTQA
jgi:transcriptional regulator with XRE-family HTH domain